MRSAVLGAVLVKVRAASFRAETKDNTAQCSIDIDHGGRAAFIDVVDDSDGKTILYQCDRPENVPVADCQAIWESIELP